MVSCGQSTLWYDSYESFILFKILMVSSTEGGSIITCWNLLVSAPSFSMCSLNSSKVVAPINCKSPLANAGFNTFAASIEPLLFPAPTTLWTSSMNSITLSTSISSSTTPLILSSNCPLYLVPATKEVKSKETILLSNNVLGASPCTILSAKPSTIVVLPTPGSPIITGLFFFFLANICATLLIESSLPITGSILPSDALLVTSIEKLSNMGVSVFLLLIFFFL